MPSSMLTGIALYRSILWIEMNGKRSKRKSQPHNILILIVGYLLCNALNTSLPQKRFPVMVEELEKAIDEYMDFYNTRRLQAKLKCLAPLAYRNQTLMA